MVPACTKVDANRQIVMTKRRALILRVFVFRAFVFICNISRESEFQTKGQAAAKLLARSGTTRQGEESWGSFPTILNASLCQCCIRARIIACLTNLFVIFW